MLDMMGAFESISTVLLPFSIAESNAFAFFGFCNKLVQKGANKYDLDEAGRVLNLVSVQSGACFPTWVPSLLLLVVRRPSVPDDEAADGAQEGEGGLGARGGEGGGAADKHSAEEAQPGKLRHKADVGCLPVFFFCPFFLPFFFSGVLSRWSALEKLVYCYKRVMLSEGCYLQRLRILPSCSCTKPSTLDHCAYPTWTLIRERHGSYVCQVPARFTGARL